MSGNFDEPDKRWGEVLKAEHGAINQRRKQQGRDPVAASFTVAGKPYGASGQFDTTGLALSGGGIRSAAFCLGAMQALADKKLLEGIDYLSTVSGGGYTGAAVTAALSGEQKLFPFQGTAKELRDPPALGHLRDHSNYLIPRGFKSVIEDVAIVVRGLVTNVLLVLPVVLLLAAITIYANPTLKSLKEPAIDIGLFSGRFAITSLLALLSFAVFALWSLYRSLFKAGEGEFGGLSLKVASWLLILLALTAFCELQPAVVAWMYEQMQAAGTQGASLDYSTIVKSIITYLTPIIAAVSLYAKRIGEFLQDDAVTGRKRDVFKRLLGKAVIWLVALALPVLLWMLYLLLVYWGVLPGIDISWLWEIWFGLGLPATTAIPPFAMVYTALALAIIVIFWWWLDPNANSLHRLYRDRLSMAFLARKGNDGETISHDVKLSAMDTVSAPYHIVNAALNIQGAPEANARGRNADFFFFTRNCCGSTSSGFRPTSEFETADPALTLGTAMAISGAAVSSNMGSSSVGPMAPTLALLNLRLGYWLRNPAGRGLFGKPFYLAKEIFSRLRPTDKYLYLTDGGHIDNTGLFELLRRRCAHIIVVDAEADPQMSFGSFVKLQRHARIDLGARINMRWDTIAATTLGLRDPKLEKKNNRGPHCAFGEIDYSNGGKGKLLYVKASLTNDENVYVRDYARRHPDYPHETTGDQFFSEEQFEVYRALGFHCVNGLTKTWDRDDVEVSRSGVEYDGTNLKKLDPAVLFGTVTAPAVKPKPRLKR